MHSIGAWKLVFSYSQPRSITAASIASKQLEQSVKQYRVDLAIQQCGLQFRNPDTDSNQKHICLFSDELIANLRDNDVALDRKAQILKTYIDEICVLCIHENKRHKCRLFHYISVLDRNPLALNVLLRLGTVQGSSLFSDYIWNIIFSHSGPREVGAFLCASKKLKIIVNNRTKPVLRNPRRSTSEFYTSPSEISFESVRSSPDLSQLPTVSFSRSNLKSTSGIDLLEGSTMSQSRAICRTGSDGSLEILYISGDSTFSTETETISSSLFSDDPPSETVMESSTTEFQEDEEGS